MMAQTYCVRSFLDFSFYISSDSSTTVMKAWRSPRTCKRSPPLMGPAWTPPPLNKMELHFCWMIIRCVIIVERTISSSINFQKMRYVSDRPIKPIKVPICLSCTVPRKVAQQIHGLPQTLRGKALGRQPRTTQHNPACL